MNDVDDWAISYMIEPCHDYLNELISMTMLGF